MKEGDLVLCTVETIDGTTVFVNLPTGEKGTIITSEIAAGRIRNIRAYVVPKKKIVCKILRIKGNHIDLSLRRVNAKEKKQVMQKYKQEQTAKSAIHSILKEQAEETEKKILKDFKDLTSFFSEAKEKKELVTKYIPQKFQEQINKITQKKQKAIEAKKIIKLKCLESDGVKKIKQILTTNNKEAKITYLSAGKFQINLKAPDYKKANQELDQILKKVEKSAKENKCEFEINEKK